MKMKMGEFFKNWKADQKKGSILILTLIYGAIAFILVSGMVTAAINNYKLATVTGYREKAFQIAEAGIEYYRWHLAHMPQDFQDGTGAAGPYAHNFYDKDGNVIGQFILDIIPPPIGSTIVKINSTGKISENSNMSRTISVKMAIPSLAKYAFVSDSSMRFGAGTEVFGPIHSNGGIRFDGLAHNLITSAKDKYHDPDESAGAPDRFGVYTTVSPADPVPPATPPSRPDVFQAGRQFPVPAVDFTGLTSDLAQIKADAETGGKYLSGSGALGYHIILKTNGTFDLYKVISTYTKTGCSNSQNQTGWDTWSINTTGGETFVSNYPFPANGLIFVEDNLWIEGQINNARLTIASGKFPDNVSTRTSITVNSNLLYTNYDGKDVIALIAQNNINIGLLSADTFRIDAALVAQNGRVGRFYYSSGCGSSYKRSQVTLYGGIATKNRYGFAYTDNTGYTTRIINYDANLLYGPPPSFPLTSDQYSILSWEEAR